MRKILLAAALGATVMSLLGGLGYASASALGTDENTTEVATTDDSSINDADFWAWIAYRNASHPGTPGVPGDGNCTRFAPCLDPACSEAGYQGDDCIPVETTSTISTTTTNGCEGEDCNTSTTTTTVPETTTTPPGDTTTVTVTVPGPTRTVTVGGGTVTVTVPGATQTVTTPAVTVTGPTTTVTNTITKKKIVIKKINVCGCPKGTRLWHGKCHKIAKGKG